MSEPVPPRPTGPFETFKAATEAAGGVLGRTSNQRLLLAAIEAAGVTLGTYDRRVVEWLAEWESSTCAVIAGMISRAAHPGDESRCAVCHAPSSQTDIHWCIPHQRWECADVSTCVERLRQVQPHGVAEESDVSAE